MPMKSNHVNTHNK